VVNRNKSPSVLTSLDHLTAVKETANSTHWLEGWTGYQVGREKQNLPLNNIGHL